MIHLPLVCGEGMLTVIRMPKAHRISVYYLFLPTPAMAACLLPQLWGLLHDEGHSFLHL